LEFETAAVVWAEEDRCGCRNAAGVTANAVEVTSGKGGEKVFAPVADPCFSARLFQQNLSN
jgi:hypothetical protein